MAQICSEELDFSKEPIFVKFIVYYIINFNIVLI